MLLALHVFHITVTQGRQERARERGQIQSATTYRIYGVDYFTTFSPIAKLASFRLLPSWRASIAMVRGLTSMARTSMANYLTMRILYAVFCDGNARSV